MKREGQKGRPGPRVLERGSVPDTPKEEAEHVAGGAMAHHELQRGEKFETSICSEFGGGV